MNLTEIMAETLYDTYKTDKRIYINTAYAMTVLERITNENPSCALVVNGCIIQMGQYSLQQIQTHLLT